MDSSSVGIEYNSICFYAIMEIQISTFQMMGSSEIKMTETQHTYVLLIVCNERVESP